MIRLAALCALLSGPAVAQTYCADRAKVIEGLKTKYSESFAGGGLQNGVYIFEVWSSEESGSWTIPRTDAAGKTCVMASGYHWREGLPVAQGEDG